MTYKTFQNWRVNVNIRLKKYQRNTMTEYHIHIDGRVMPSALQKAVEAIGFVQDTFTGHPDGYRHFEPVIHLTKKLQTKEKFEDTFASIEKVLEDSEFIGYIEGEYIRPIIIIPEITYNSDILVPFQIERRQLRNDEAFRQSEFHLEMDGDASHPKLITNLLDAGLYGAFYPENGYRGIVLTMQGYVKDILPLQGVLRQYLEEAGGAVSSILYEERALRHRLFKITSVDLPEIADRITYR